MRILARRSRENRSCSRCSNPIGGMGERAHLRPCPRTPSPTTYYTYYRGGNHHVFLDLACSSSGGFDYRDLDYVTTEVSDGELAKRLLREHIALSRLSVHPHTPRLEAILPKSS